MLTVNSNFFTFWAFIERTKFLLEENFAPHRKKGKDKKPYFRSAPFCTEQLQNLNLSLAKEK